MKNSGFKHTRVIIVIALLSLVYFACDDAGIGPPKTYPFIIAGTITGLTSANNTLVAAVSSITGGINTLASCSIDNDGNFGFFPPTVDESTLYPTDSIFSAVCNGGPIAFNPGNVKGTVISSFGVFNGNQLIGYVDCNNYNQSDPRKTGDFDLWYVYLDKEVSANGYKLCMSDTVFVYGNAHAGWNKVYRLYKRVEPGSMSIVYYYSTLDLAVWKYHSF